MSADILGVIAPHPPIMVPAVGGEQIDMVTASTEAMSVAAQALSSYDPDTIVIMSPHSPAISDAFVVETAETVRGTLSQFGAPEVELVYKGDSKLALKLLERLTVHGIPALDREAVKALSSGHLDHGVLVPMSFLDPESRWPILNLSISYLSYEMHRTLGFELVAAAIELGRKIAFVASGDCSHRLTSDAPAGYSPRGEELDQAIMNHVAASDLEGLMHLDPDLVEAGGECGLRSLITLGGVTAPEHARVLSYEGPWGVGYLTALVNESVTPDTGQKGGTPGEKEHEIVTLARRTIEDVVEGRDPSDPEPLSDPGLPQKAGAFVSLHREHNLRGCIGTISPVSDTLTQEVIRNAIEASLHDPRFPSLTSDELSDLEISVDVLHPPEPATFDQLDPTTYGVIVTSGGRRGLLLPDLEGVDTAQQQVDIASRKAGILPGEKVVLERFRVDRYA